MAAVLERQFGFGIDAYAAKCVPCTFVLRDKFSTYLFLSTQWFQTVLVFVEEAFTQWRRFLWDSSPQI